MEKLTWNWISLKNQSYREGKKKSEVSFSFMHFFQRIVSFLLIASDHYWEPEYIIFFFLYCFGKKYLEVDKRKNYFIMLFNHRNNSY